MSKVIHLDKGTTPESARSTIIDNLKNIHHGKFVNIWCVVRGIDDFSLATKALDALIGENVVERRAIRVTDMRNKQVFATMYKYNPFCGA